jgi:CMP-N-acetylneuraminic acid synthetase
MPKKIKQNIAIIPARGGSKRLPGKNIKMLGGKPLVNHTIEAALNAKSISSVMVSSDSEEILNIASSYSEVMIHRREDNLASDTSTALELVEHIYLNLDDEYRYITLMLPTCPFRNSEHLDEGFGLLEDSDDGVISVTSYEFPITLNVPVNEHYIQLTENSPLITGNTRSQNHKPSYRPNGGFYISRWSSFEKNRNFWKGNVKYYFMNRIHSIDIDDQIDLDFANMILNEGS